MGRIANAIKDYKNLKNERLGGFYANDFIEILDMSTSEFEIMANSFNAAFIIGYRAGKREERKRQQGRAKQNR